MKLPGDLDIAKPSATLVQRKLFLGANGLVRPIWRVVLFVFVSLWMLSATAQGLTLLIAGFPVLSLQVWHFGISFLYLVNVFALLLLTALFIRVLDRRSFRTLGFWFYEGWARETVFGLGCGAGVIAIAIGGIAASGGVAFAGFANGISSWFGGASGTAVFVLLAAVAEEITFRGYAFQRLVDATGKLGAVLVLSVLFGAAHMRNPGHPSAIATANTVLAGVLLAVAYLKTSGLWMPLGLHWAWNFFLGPVFGLPVSGFTDVFRPHLLKAHVGEPEWLTGAAYGPEGSIILTVACIAAIVWLARTRRISPSPAMAEALK